MKFIQFKQYYYTTMIIIFGLNPQNFSCPMKYIGCTIRGAVTKSPDLSGDMNDLAKAVAYY